MIAVADPLFVIDDDPTGAQAQAGVPLLMSWEADRVTGALGDEPPALHLLTNSRALDEDGAYAIVREAAGSAAGAIDEPQVVLRGDSTLRAHLLPEYLAVRDALVPGETPPLLLVPALPAAGRVTVGGQHLLERDGRRTPLGQTEFATDADFGYASSRLLDWAQERSGGYFPAADGREIELAAVRSEAGADLVCQALLDAAADARPAVVIPDAETVADLETIAVGLRRAWERAPGIVVRCAPTFASVLSGAGAKSLVPPPSAGRGLLVVVGSHVPVSSAQLQALVARHPEATIEVDAATLASAGEEAALLGADVVARARERLASGRLAIVATSREVVAAALGPVGGTNVARALAGIVAELRGDSGALLSKGGSTSAINVRDGLAAESVEVVGPVAPGISLWLVPVAGAEPYPVIVFPGNVGDADTLADLVDRIMEA